MNENANILPAKARGVKPKYNYDGLDFYIKIMQAAMNGASDAETADYLDLEPTTFSDMKNGTYAPWSEEENKSRSSKIKQVLTSARIRNNRVVKATLLTTILGKWKSKNVSTVKRKMRDSKGEETGDIEIQTTEQTVCVPPSIQGMATWLYHHDPEWRDIQKGNVPEEVTDAEHGVDISEWIKGKMEE